MIRMIDWKKKKKILPLIVAVKLKSALSPPLEQMKRERFKLTIEMGC
jgi:hypothetical protein